MAEQFNSKYFRGQGPLFIGSRDAAGKPTGLTFVGDLSSVEMSASVERFQVVENVTGSAGIGASGVKKTEFQISIAMRSIKKEHLALALQGAVVDKTGASVTDESHTAYLDKFTTLDHNKVSTVVVTGTGGTPTYVAGTDYIVHADEGMVEFISGGTITDATAVLVDYSYAAQYHVSSNPSNDDKYLVFAGMNTADNNKQTRVEIYKVKLDPSVMSLITDEPGDATISGIVELDTLRTSGDQFFSWKVEV